VDFYGAVVSFSLIIVSKRWGHFM